MQNILNIVRSFIGFGNVDADLDTHKRDRRRVEDYSDDEEPSLKRLKRLSSTKFPRSMEDQDDHNRTKSYVRLVPIQVEGRPSTSTPYESSARPTARSRTTHLLDLTDVQQRSHTPNLVTHYVSDDDPDIIWREPKENNCKRNQRKPHMYVRVDEENDDDVESENDSDVVCLDRLVYPRKKYIVSNNRESSPARSPRYQLCKKYQERREPSPRAKFKSPAGVTKAYRPKPSAYLPKWLTPMRTSSLCHIPLPNKVSEMNGNTRTAILEAFNLEEKQHYRDLIMESERSERKPMTPVKMKPIEMINLEEKCSPIGAHIQKRRTEQINLTSSKISSKIEDKEINLITSGSDISSGSEVEKVNSSNASTSTSIRVSPVNTLRTSLDSRKWAKPVWLNSRRDYHKEKKDEKKKAACERLEVLNRISEINKSQNMEQMTKMLIDSLKLSEFDDLEVQPVVEIPQLTPEQDKVVDRAIGPGPSGEVFIEKFNLKIHRRDLQTLAGLNWLNDEVINFYMNLIMQRCEENASLPKVYTTNTFFYPKLMQSGQPGLRRWTRKVDIFAHQLMVIPVHLGVHWCLCLVEMDKRRVLYLDSMGGANQRCLDAVLQYLRDEHQDKKGQPFDHSGWRKEQLKDIPQQMNGSDCGMFACTFAEYASRRAEFTFSQSDMPLLRRKLAYEIIKGKLML